MSFQPTRRLGTIKGLHGEIIVTKTYTNWRYSVSDWLSKYSAAI
jgi:hypothetical protein